MSKTQLPYFDAGAVARALPYPRLVAALKDAFGQPFHAPQRTIHTLPGERQGLLVLMPIAQQDSIGLKIATVFPDNPTRAGLASIHALVLLLDGNTGVPQAVLDGTEITRRRTAAASALASSFLAREDARTLLMIGTGALAPYLIAAHCSVRPITTVLVWGRSEARAQAAAEIARRERPDLNIVSTSDLPAAAARADVISCATSSKEPVLHGRWLRAGTHVDLVGSFSPDAREADDDVVRGARIFVDTRESALAEAGDLIIPLSKGVISEAAIAGELAGLCTGALQRRTDNGQTTIFKSVGSALEDLVAARLVFENA